MTYYCIIRSCYVYFFQMKTSPLFLLLLYSWLSTCIHTSSSFIIWREDTPNEAQRVEPSAEHVDLDKRVRNEWDRCLTVCEIECGLFPDFDFKHCAKTCMKVDKAVFSAIQNCYNFDERMPLFG